MGKEPSKSSEAQPSRRDERLPLAGLFRGLSHAVNPPRGLRTALARRECCTSDFRVSGGAGMSSLPHSRQRDHCLQQQTPSELRVPCPEGSASRRSRGRTRSSVGNKSRPSGAEKTCWRSAIGHTGLGRPSRLGGRPAEKKPPGSWLGLQPSLVPCC